MLRIAVITSIVCFVLKDFKHQVEKIMKNNLLSTLVASAALAFASFASAGTLDDVKKRGHLQCGINTGLPGFAYTDDKGNWQGFDVAYCGKSGDGVPVLANVVQQSTITLAKSCAIGTLLR